MAANGSHRTTGRVAIGLVATLLIAASLIPAATAGAAGVVPPGAPLPQPSPQCPSPANLKDWFQPNCPYTWTFADPSIVVVPGDANLGGATGYYAYGTNTGGSSLPVMWTTDPLNGPWIPRPAYTGNFNGDPYFNDALSAPYTPGGNQPPAWMIAGAPNGTGWARKKLWAPGALRINATSYITYFAGEDRAGHWCIGHATAANPWGPFTAANTPDICTPPDGSPNGVIDPQPFRAPDGTLYLHYKSEGVPGSKPTSIYSRPLTAAGLLAPGTTSTRIYSTDATWQMSNPTTGAGVVENPAMVHYKGRYYLFYSANEWRTDNYGTGYAICSGPSGPCTNKSTSGPLLRNGSGYTGAGGATPFITADGSLVIGFAAWNVPGNHTGGTRTFRTRQVFARSDGALTFTDPNPSRPPLSDPVADAKFVRAAYLDFLGRSATNAEATAWANSISTGNASRAGFLGMLTTSPEWIGATVDRLYIDTLGRPADAAGKTYWIGALQTKRVTVAQAAASFYSSPEYFAGYGESSVRTWILDLYRKILLRSGADDTAGVDYWVARTTSVGRGEVALAFYQSSESRHTRVDTLYRKLLNRPPEQGGWDYWANRILTLGDLSLAANLGASPEYYQRAQSR